MPIAIDWNQKLLDAASEGRISDVKMALDNGANINARNRNQDTPLIRSAKNGRIDCLNFLIKSKVNIDATDINGETALSLASFFGKLDCVQSLINANANLYAIDNDGNTALMSAAAWNKIDCLKLLIKTEPKLINIKNDSGNSALNWALITDKTDAIELLIIAGAETEHLQGKHKQRYSYIINEVNANKQAFQDAANNKNDRQERQVVHGNAMIKIHTALKQKKMATLKRRP